MPQLLTEEFEMTPELIESADGGRVKFRGKFGIVDEATANGRLYRSQLMEREIGRLGEDLRLRGVLGHLDHPDDGRTKLEKVSHIITSLSVTGGEILGATEVLSTPNGKILEALARDRVRLGVSLRGYGSTERKEHNGRMVEEVSDDFYLETFDFVYKPAAHAYPQIVAEAQRDMALMESGDIRSLSSKYADLDEVYSRAPQTPGGSQMSANSLGAEVPKVRTEEEIGAELRPVIEAEVRSIIEAEVRPIIEADVTSGLVARFDERLRSVVEGLSAKAMARARSEALSDPHVAGAKKTLNEVARMLLPYAVGPDISEEIRRRDARITALEAEMVASKTALSEARSEVAKVSDLATRAAFALRVEQTSRGCDDETRRKVAEGVGEVGRFQSLEELDTVLASLKESIIDKVRSEATSRENLLQGQISMLREELDRSESAAAEKLEAVESEKATLAEEKAELDSKLAEEKAKVQKISDLSETAAVQAFAEGVARSHPNADLVRVSIRAAKTLREAFEVVTAFDVAQSQVRDLSEDDASRVQQGARGHGRDPDGDTRGRRVSGASVPIPGLNIARINRVAG